MISSLTFQAIWIDRDRNRHQSRYDNPVYMKNKEGNKIDGNIYNDNTNNKYTNPIYYMNLQGNIHPFTREMETAPNFKNLVYSEQPFAYLPNSYSPYFLINIRITKEIGKHVRFSFYANNIAVMNPSRFKNSAATYVSMNPPPFHGIELQFNL